MHSKLLEPWAHRKSIYEDCHYVYNVDNQTIAMIEERILNDMPYWESWSLEEGYKEWRSLAAAKAGVEADLKKHGYRFVPAKFVPMK